MGNKSGEDTGLQVLTSNDELAYDNLQFSNPRKAMPKVQVPAAALVGPLTKYSEKLERLGIERISPR